MYFFLRQKNTDQEKKLAKSDVYTAQREKFPFSHQSRQGKITRDITEKIKSSIVLL
jgi:hypothetical protein